MEMLFFFVGPIGWHVCQLWRFFASRSCSRPVSPIEMFRNGFVNNSGIHSCTCPTTWHARDSAIIVPSGKGWKRGVWIVAIRTHGEVRWATSWRIQNFWKAEGWKKRVLVGDDNRGEGKMVERRYRIWKNTNTSAELEKGCQIGWWRGCTGRGSSLTLRDE